MLLQRPKKIFLKSFFLVLGANLLLGNKKAKPSWVKFQK
jgi:hypothetical protein